MRKCPEIPTFVPETNRMERMYGKTRWRVLGAALLALLAMGCASKEPDPADPADAKRLLKVQAEAYSPGDLAVRWSGADTLAA